MPTSPRLVKVVICNLLKLLLFLALLARRATEGNIVIRPSQLQGGQGGHSQEGEDLEGLEVEEPSKPIQ